MARAVPTGRAGSAAGHGSAGRGASDEVRLARAAMDPADAEAVQ